VLPKILGAVSMITIGKNRPLKTIVATLLFRDNLVQMQKMTLAI
jgi:hypothetical protein